MRTLYAFCNIFLAVAIDCWHLADIRISYERKERRKKHRNKKDVFRWGSPILINEPILRIHFVAAISRGIWRASKPKINDKCLLSDACKVLSDKYPVCCANQIRCDENCPPTTANRMKSHSMLATVSAYALNSILFRTFFGRAFNADRSWNRWCARTYAVAYIELLGFSLSFNIYKQHWPQHVCHNCVFRILFLVRPLMPGTSRVTTQFKLKSADAHN